MARWLDAVDEDAVCLRYPTLGVLREGADGLAPGRRRDRLDRWLASDLPERFAGRVLPVDAAVAERWGRLGAAAARNGRRLPSTR